MSYYKGICREFGKEIEEKYAFGYALERVITNKDEQNEFVEWYYSGNWIRIEED